MPSIKGRSVQERLEALRQLIALPQENPQAVGVGIAIIVLVAIVLVLLLIAIALPGRRQDSVEERDEIPRELDFFRRLVARQHLAKRWESALLSSSILLIGLTVSAVMWYTATSTNTYCAKTCHAMAKPAAEWRLSAHKKVECVRCHEGPAWVSLPRALVSRSRSLYYEITETSATPRPVPGETCLQCHEGLGVREIVGRNGAIFTHDMVISDERTCKTCHGAQGHVAP